MNKTETVRKHQKKIMGRMLRSRSVKGFIGFTQRKQFPGYKEISWYAVVEFFIRWVDKRDLHLRTSALSYTFFLSLFPTAIFFFTLIAYLPLKRSPDEILFFLEGIMPVNTFNMVKSALEDILKSQRGGLLSVGFVAAIYFSTNGLHSLMNTLNRYAKQKETRSFWKQRTIAIILAVLVSVAILISVLLVTAGNWMIQTMDKMKYFPSKITPTLLFLLNNGIVILIILTIISCIYYFAPNKSAKWKFLTPGSIFACITIILTTTIFSVYVNQFNSYNKVYGSIGALIVIMLLIYINTYILLLGFELNIAIEKAVAEIKKNKGIKANRVFFIKIQSERGEDEDS